MRNRSILLPAGFTVLLLGFSLLPRINQNASLRASLWIVAAILLAWCAYLALSARRISGIDVVIRRPHYMQAFIQFSIYLYWGYYWRQVYNELPLIFAQLAFAYALDCLVSLTRRGKWTIGFGPFPIVFSTNFFIWFRDEFFYLQFLMLAVIFLAKEFIRWEREGRSSHIFNPAAFGLALASAVLILTKTTHITWAQEIVTTLDYPPNIYLYLFVLGLNGMYFFAVTPVAAMTAVGLVALGSLYAQATGVYYFIDSEIPVAVFLGLHLLITDPATSPKNFWGRALFGALYATTIFILYGVLWWAGAPTFYDKILCVPLLNLAVRAIDRFCERRRGFKLPSIVPQLTPYQRNLAFMAVWITFFISMRALGGFAETHEGTRVTYWQKACENGLRSGCQILTSIEAAYCDAGSGWACNELGVQFSEGKVISRNPQQALRRLGQACELGFAPACTNVTLAAAPQPARLYREAPTPRDFKLLLQEGKGELPPMGLVEIQTKACAQGWGESCAHLGMMHLQGQGTDVNHARAASYFETACSLGQPTSCANLGLMYRRGDGVQTDVVRAVGLLSRACDLGMPAACRWLSEERARPN